MKSRTRAIVNVALVETLTQNGGLFTASRVGPAEHLRCPLSFCIDSDQAMPKRRRSNVGYLAFYLRRLRQHIIDCRERLIESLVRVDLCSAVIGYRKLSFILHKRARQHVAI